MSQQPGSYGLDSYDPRRHQYASQRPITPPRTPSPTPSEIAELRKGPVDFKTILNPKTYMHKKYIPWFIGAGILIVLVVLMALYHTQIVDWLTPLSRKLKELPAGWVIPIAILFVISFPPLFGHEIVAVLCGVVWGLWVGFGIVAAGTFLGEVGNFYAFRYCCASRGKKLEKDNLSYACLARIVRDGGFLVALVARLSAIPGHFTTAVFSTCGMSIWVFSIAAILSLPKQLITVYLGVIIEQSNDNTESNKNRIISDVVLVVSFAVTILAAWWLMRKMAQVKPEVMRERRKARALKDLELGVGRGPLRDPYRSTERLTASVDNDAFNPNESDEELGYPSRDGPIPAPVSVQPQRWDAHGRAIPLLYDPPRGAPHQREQSGNDAAWDVRRDGGSTAYAPRPAYATSPTPVGSRTQSPSATGVFQRAPAVYPPAPQDNAPQGQPPRPNFYSPPPESPHNLPLSQTQSLPPASPYLPPPGSPPSGPSPTYFQSPATPQQPAIPANVPRFQLHDGPAPSIMSAAPTYHTIEPPRPPFTSAEAQISHGSQTPPYSVEESLPMTPRIPPPPSGPYPPH